MNQPVRWIGAAPRHCQLCGDALIEEFIDARLIRHGGSWACICTVCANENGVTLGVGRGQRFVLQTDGSFLKDNSP